MKQGDFGCRICVAEQETEQETDRQTDLIVGPNPVSFAVQAKNGAMEEHIPLVQFPMTLEWQDSPLGYDQC